MLTCASYGKDYKGALVMLNQLQNKTDSHIFLTFKVSHFLVLINQYQLSRQLVCF